MVKLARPTLGLLAAATLVAAVYWFGSPRTLSGADLLPPTTPVFFQTTNVTAAITHWAQTPAAAVMKPHQDAAVRETSGLMKRWSNLAETVRRGVAELAEGEVFVAFTDLQITPRIVPQLAVGIQIGQRGAQAQQWLDQLQRQLKRDFPAASFSRQKHADTDYQRWPLEPGLEICAAILGNRLVLTLCSEPMMAIIDHYRDTSHPTLAGSESFRAVRSRLPKQADWVLVTQTESLVKTLEPFLQWMPQLQALTTPLAQLEAIGAAQAFDGGRIRDALVVAHKTSPSQPRHAFKPALLERLPASCVAGALADVAAADVYKLVNQITLALGNRDWMKVQTLFEGGWTTQQIDFAHDVLGTLDTPTAVALDWPAGQRRLAVLFGAPVREPDRLAAIMRRFDGAAQPAPIRWRVINGWLWMSFSEEALERVNRAASGPAPSWRMDTEAASLAAGGGWLWFFTDTARFATAPDRPEAIRPLLAGTSRHGRFDETATVSSLGSWVNAWLAIEAANRPPTRK